MPPSLKKPLLVCIVGPTAVGKTSLSIKMAKHFDAQIISADSRQMYKHISIGTAKPSLEEQKGIPHHFLDFLELEEEYSAGQFERDALELIQNELKDQEVIILCGGSGLYVKALLQGLDDIPKDDEVRSDLNALLADEGLEPLLAELQSLDPISYKRIDKKNPQRVIRALEVCRVSGKPFSSFHEKNTKERPFEVLLIGLRREREELNKRIATRFSEMMEAGWLQEAQRVFDSRHLNSLNTVGYKELFQHIEGNLSMEECKEKIVRETQRFAKRQMTWFKRMDKIQWIDLPASGVEDILIQRVEHIIHR